MAVGVIASWVMERGVAVVRVMIGWSGCLAWMSVAVLVVKVHATVPSLAITGVDGIPSSGEVNLGTCGAAAVRLTSRIAPVLTP